MKITSKITITGHDKLYPYLANHTKQRDRSTVTVSSEGSDVTVLVEANDAVAFRAALNALTQSLAIFEGIAENGNKNTGKDQPTANV